MFETSTPEFVACFVTVVVQHDLCVILGRQAAKRYPGLLRPPGGGVEQHDSTLAMASLREFTEETGLTFPDLGTARDVHQIYSTGNENGIFTLFGVHCRGHFTNRELLNLITARHADAKCPGELTEIKAVPVLELFCNPAIRYDLAPDFRAEITVEPTATKFDNYIKSIA